MSDRLTPEWVNNAIAVNISRDRALMFGLVTPTPEEAAEGERRARQYDVRRRESWRLYDEARAALASITDPLARAILDLHATDTIERPTCGGCDIDGYEAEAPEWPCRTVQTVADQYEITLPDPAHLWRRP